MQLLDWGSGPIRIVALALLYALLALGLNIGVGYAGLLASPHLVEQFPWIAATFPNRIHAPILMVVPLAALLRRSRSSGASTTLPS